MWVNQSVTHVGELDPSSVQREANCWDQLFCSQSKAQEDKSQRWYIVAIIVGSLVVLGVGGFGGMGF